MRMRMDGEKTMVECFLCEREAQMGPTCTTLGTYTRGVFMPVILAANRTGTVFYPSEILNLSNI